MADEIIDPDTIELALVILEEGGLTGTVRVLVWQGQPWLVPWWNEYKGRPATKPARLIPLTRLRHQHLPPHAKGVPNQWTVNDPLPNALFGATVPPQLAAQYGVVESPPIEVPIRPGQN